MPLTPNFALSIAAIARQIPDPKAVSLLVRGEGDEVAETVSWAIARHQPKNQTEMDGLSNISATWQLYVTNGETAVPARGDWIVYSGRKWAIAAVVRKFNNLIFDCSCVDVTT